MRSDRWNFLAAGMVGCCMAATLCGCGRGPNLPPTARVDGTVTLDGNPLPRGTVQFIPDPEQGTAGTPAVGNIGGDGRYTLRTAGAQGAIVGHHRVRVEARAEPKNEMDTWPPSLIPERYNHEQTSGLIFEVTAGGRNEIDIELTSR